MSDCKNCKYERLDTDYAKCKKGIGMFIPGDCAHYKPKKISIEDAVGGDLFMPNNEHEYRDKFCDKLYKEEPSLSDDALVGFAMYAMYELGDLFKDPKLLQDDIKKKIEDKLVKYKQGLK